MAVGCAGGMLFAMPLWYGTCKQRGFVGFGMVFAGDISDVMSDGEEQRRFEACEHKHTTSQFRIHLAKAELAVPFFCTDIHYIVYKIHQKASFFPHTTRNGKSHTIFSLLYRIFQLRCINFHTLVHLFTLIWQFFIPLQQILRIDFSLFLIPQP